MRVQVRIRTRDTIHLTPIGSHFASNFLYAFTLTHHYVISDRVGLATSISRKSVHDVDYRV